MQNEDNDCLKFGFFYSMTRRHENQKEKEEEKEKG